SIFESLPIRNVTTPAMIQQAGGSQETRDRVSDNVLLKPSKTPSVQKQHELGCKERFGRRDCITLLALVSSHQFAPVYVQYQMAPQLAWILRPETGPVA